METFEFEVVVHVRKTIHISGPKNREAAREVLFTAIRSGININTFAKRDEAGHPIEQIVDDQFKIFDPL